MELTNAQTEEELYQKILDDMLNYNEQAAGHYDDYIGIFENFLAEYKSNLEELQRLKEMELSLKNSSDYLGGNGIDIPVTSKNYNGTGMKMSGSWEEGHDYLQEALDAAKNGDMDKAYDALTKRGYKIQSTGKNYGTTQEQALSMVLKAGNVKGYATGLDQGPVTETGPAILHGTPDNPEYVLNNDQAYNLLSNLSDTPAQELTSEDMINLNDNNIEDGNMSTEGEGADSQGDSTAGRISGESEGSGSSFAGGATGGAGQGNLDAICSYLVTIINLLNQLNSIENNGNNLLTQINTTEVNYNSQIVNLIQQAYSLLEQMYELMQTDYQDDIDMYAQILESVQIFNENYNKTMASLFDRWDSNIPVIQELLTSMNDYMRYTMELVDGILQTLGGGMSGGFSAGGKSGSWTGTFNSVKTPTNSNSDGKSKNKISSNKGSGGGGNKGNSGGGSSGSWTEEELWYSDPNHAPGSFQKESSVSSGWGGMTDYSAMHEAVANGSKLHVRDDGVYDDNNNKVHSFANGLKGGPVTYTGLAMLHGTPSEPEYILNNDQAYNLLYNMSSARMADFETKSNEDSGIQYIVQGDIILEGVEDPAKFWQEVTNAMGNRWNVTKNK